MDYFRELNFVSVALRLLLSAVIGFSLGLERGRKRRPAGCRTYMLVCMGATLTRCSANTNTSWSPRSGRTSQVKSAQTDVTRIGAKVIDGVGFLGAGTIIVTGRQEVKGLTTAAGLWASACMGLAIGAGFYECVFLGSVLIFLSIRLSPASGKLMVERARNMNLYIEFESLDHIGLIIGTHQSAERTNLRRLTTTGARSGRARSQRRVHHSSGAQHHHSQVIAAISELDDVMTIDEI